jgi:glycosyltransferase involved in cell wall biosynthesis
VSYYHNEEPLGTPENWNNAVRKSRGEYIKIMHHDDWFISDNALKDMVYEMEHNAVDFVFCQSAGDYHNYPATEVVNSYIGNRLPYLLTGNIIGAPSATMYRRNSLEYDAKIKYYVDVDFYIHYLMDHKIGYIQKDLVQIGTTPVRVTDEVIEDRNFIYGEFQYAFLKLWNSKIWRHSDLCNVFKKYIKDNQDFGSYSIPGLAFSQKRIICQQYLKSIYKKFKRGIKHLVK